MKATSRNARASRQVTQMYQAAQYPVQQQTRLHLH
jgi:hypothetical protein